MVTIVDDDFEEISVTCKLCEVPHVLTIFFTQTPTVAASDASSGPSVGAVAGGVTGAAVALLLLALIVLIICCRRRKKRSAANRSDSLKNQIGKYSFIFACV